MKIGFLFDDNMDRPDGVQQYLACLGEWMQSQGHSVKYLVSDSQDPIVPGERVISLAKSNAVRGNSNTLSLPSLADRNQIADVLAAEKFDIVHVQMPYSPMLSGRVVDALSNECLFGTFHIVGKGWLINAGSRLLSELQSSQYDRFDQILSVSTAAQDYAKNYFRIESSVEPNVFNLKKYKTEKQDVQSNSVLFMGRLVERKGCEYIIKAAKLLKDDGKNIKLTIAGKGPLKNKLEVLANRLGVDADFVGFVDEKDKAELFNSHRFAVFPSVGGESFGIILLEAMAAMRSGIVLAGNNQGYATVMGQEYLFDIKSPTAIASKISTFMDKNLTDDIKIQDKTAAEYDVNIVGPRIIRRYQACIKQRQ